LDSSASDCPAAWGSASSSARPSGEGRLGLRRVGDEPGVRHRAGYRGLRQLGHSRLSPALSLPGDLPAGAARAARESLEGAGSAADRLPAAAGRLLAEAAGEAFTTAFNVGAGVAAVMFAGLAVLAIAALREVPASADADAPAAEPEPVAGHV
jgi:DHA2 family multidrug resistance protein-like MFS transporter